MISFHYPSAHNGSSISAAGFRLPRLCAPNGITCVSKAQIVSIIDDDASVRAAVEGLVRSAGFVAFTFESAEGFLRSPRAEDSACLITDVQMPGMSGLDLQNRLIAQGSRIPIIFITAFPEQDIRNRAQAAGAIAFLEKPFDGGTMINLVRKALATQSP
jgi:FixJ family two-component response regulator